ncbi:MAG: hypothetical protein HQK54_18635, partial [Oligoflexales bacterium]|nr:hypothetical protein [Oligoflexales bacterium]
MRNKSYLYRPFFNFLFLTGIIASTSSYSQTDLDFFSDQTLFRNIFYTYAHEKYMDQDIKEMVLYPLREFVTPPMSMSESGDPIAAFYSKEERMAKLRPEMAYYKSLETGFTQLGDISRHDAVTIILIPGILGEFIEYAPYEEVLSSKANQTEGSFQSTVNERLKDVYDSAYSLQHLKEIRQPLSKLLRTGSIYDKDGKAVVNLIYMNPLFASLETLGKLTDNNEIYDRRLDRFFEIMGPMKNLYFMGYSQGALVALTYLNHLKENTDSHPWSNEIKGMISLSGVLHGTAISDTALDENEPKHGLVEKLDKLTEGLVDSANPKTIASNSVLWASFLADMTGELSKKSDPDALISKEKIKSPSFSQNAIVRTIYKAFMSLGLNKPIRDYPQNVRRFKIFYQKVREGMVGMSTEARMKWWSENQIPADITYYAINGTMADAYREGIVSPLIDSRYLGPQTTDYKFLRGSFYDIYNYTKVDLNDSQVAVHRSTFWPDMHMAL